MTSHEYTTEHRSPRTHNRRRWGRRIGLSLVLMLGLGGVAYASGAVPHHPGHPPHTAEHVDQMIEHLLSQVDGTADQQVALKAIAARTGPKMEALHLEGHDLKVELHDLLTAEKIDRAALEVARKDGLDLADRGSKLLVTAVADAAEALTPAQRRKISEVMQRFGR